MINATMIYLALRAIPKTMYFNFKYLKFKDALKMPILVSHRVLLMETEGKIEINKYLKTAMVRIGFGKVAIFDQHNSRTIWQVSGLVVFSGNTHIGHGSEISVASSGTLSFGDNFLNDC